LLKRVVNAHPMMAIATEIHWVTDAFPRGRWNSHQCVVTAEMLRTLVKHERFPRLNVSPDDFLRQVSPDKPIKGAKFLSRLFDLYSLVRGKALVGSKTPAYVNRLTTIHKVWPETKFIHIIRDGREVCLSILDWPYAGRTAGRYSTWAQDPVATTALWWKRKVRLGQEAGRALDPALYHEVRYEDLVADPAGTCAVLCHFLNIPYDEAMARFHDGPERDAEIDHPWQPITAGLRDWRTQMPADACLRFEAAAGDLLEQLGYPRAYACLPPEAEAEAERIQQLFDAEASAQGDRLPEIV
jgi:hypothetical protein